MTYAGLTTADKPALLDAKARGAEWVARDKDDELVGFRLKPQKYVDMELNIDHWKRTQAGNYFIVMPSDEPLKFIQWSDAEPVNIDLALAQIAEMESKTLSKEQIGKVLAEIIDSIENKPPLTWNERINQMTVEEKAVFFSELFNCATCPIIEECQHDCNTMLTKWLNSPYTEGATK